jgi:hypothetical protein
MNVEPERIAMVVILAVFGLLMAFAGNAIMDYRQPVHQESQLLENFLIMQSMAGKNTTPSNLTYVMGSTGIVVSFNDLVNNNGVTIHQQKPTSNRT